MISSFRYLGEFLINPATIRAIIWIMAMMTLTLLIIKLKDSDQYTWHKTKIRLPYYIHRHAGKIAVISSVLLIVLTATVIVPSPQVTHPPSPLFEPIIVNDQRPLIVRFDRPISRNIIPSITPQVPGDWVYSSAQYGPLLTDQIEFHPHHSLQPETEYIINLDRILPIAWTSIDKAQKYLFVFSTPTLTQVTQISPNHESTNININSPIIISFSPGDYRAVDWSYKFQPPFEYAVTYNQDYSQATLQPAQALKQGVQYNLEISRTPITYDYQHQTVTDRQSTAAISSTKFTTVASPAISSISPNASSLLPNQPLTISFVEAMDQPSVEAAITLNPDIELNYIWDNASTFSIVPADKWQEATQYELVIAAGAKTEVGGALESTFAYQFETIGRVEVADIQPATNATNIAPSTDIRITFDQPVETQTAASALRIDPDIIGSISWEDQTLVYRPNNQLAYDTEYTVSLEPGIGSVSGLDSEESYASSFRTAPQEFSLNIPLYNQNHTFTCFSATAQMVLAYRGYTNISELGFLDEIGYQDTPRNYATNTWGDPNQGIVGTYNGTGQGGYGTHWDPVARAIGTYTPTQVKRDWNIPELLEEVKSGNPVLVWWVNGVWPAKDVSWNTPEGKKVYTVNGMHVEVVKGWIGDQENPQYILTNDPWRGNRRYTPDAFLNLWKWFNNTAVIVY